MFVTSDALKKRIHQVSAEIFRSSNSIISFEEYIALPFYGNICLRFCLNRTEYNLDDLDQYEQMIHDIVQDEFIVDFMGDVYRKAGVDYRRMDEIFERCSRTYKDEVIGASIYAQQLREDGAYLLNRCGLDETLPVWEIQPDEEILLFILGRENKKCGTYSVDGRTVQVLEADRTPCEGLTKAAFYAKRNRVSLIRAMLENQQA